MLMLLPACGEGPQADHNPAEANIDPGVFAGVARPLPAQTPRDAILHFLNAIQQRDRVLYSTTIDGEPDELGFAEERFATEAMLHEFLAAMEKTYGRHICRTFPNFTALDRRDRWPSPAEAQANMRLVTEEDRAVAVLPGPEGKLLHLHRQGETWVLEIGEHLPPPKDRPALLDAYRRLRPILLRVRPLVDVPGQTGAAVWSRFLTEMDPPAWMQEDSDSSEPA
jgi:hypothetical protein